MSEEKSDFAQKKQLIEGLAVYPALMIMVFIRRRVGFRLLHPIWLGVIGLVLIGLPEAYKDLAKPYPALTALFGLAMLAYSRLQRFFRWRDICKGVRWHSYSPGLSYLEYIPWPRFLWEHRRIYRFLDPLLCLALSIIAAFFSQMLGGVIALGGLGLAIYENALFERMLKAKLDTLDGLLESEVQKEFVEHFSEGQTAAQQPIAMQETAGIPTGIAPDIDRQVMLRKAKRRQPPPDNLVASAA